MDALAKPTASGVWTVEATDGVALGAIEQRPEGFVVLASVGSQLGDFDVPPYTSLETVLAGIGAHSGGECRLSAARNQPDMPPDR